MQKGRTTVVVEEKQQQGQRPEVEAAEEAGAGVLAAQVAAEQEVAHFEKKKTAPEVAAKVERAVVEGDTGAVVEGDTGAVDKAVPGVAAGAGEVVEQMTVLVVQEVGPRQEWAERTTERHHKRLEAKDTERKQRGRELRALAEALVVRASRLVVVGAVEGKVEPVGLEAVPEKGSRTEQEGQQTIAVRAIEMRVERQDPKALEKNRTQAEQRE